MCIRTSEFGKFRALALNAPSKLAHFPTLITLIFFFLSWKLQNVLKKENRIIQVLFKVYVQFSSTFQDEFGFQGLFKTALHFLVLFKTVSTMQEMG